MQHKDLSNPYYLEWDDFLRESEHWSRDMLEWYQLHQIQSILLHAYRHAQFYHDLYDGAGIHPSDVKCLADVQCLPLTTRQMMQQSQGRHVTMPGRWYYTTGGSTGEPLGIYREPIYWGQEQATKAHHWRRAGWDEAHRMFLLKGFQPIDAPDHMEEYPQFHELRCSAFHLDANSMQGYHDRAWGWRPDWLYCYPSAGYMFARFLAATSQSFPPILGVLCASEMLYDAQKQLMAEVFDTRVFAHYGQTESVCVAAFCEGEDTYHVLPQYGYAELIGQNGQPVTEPGQVGEIVGTSFNMRASPFIRYRTGDYAVYGGQGCPACGRPYQIWSRIEGKAQEYLVADGGRLVSMGPMNIHGAVGDLVWRFQFVQTEIGRVTFQYVPSSLDVAGLREVIEHKLGPGMRVEMKPVRGIAYTERAKHRYVIQELDIDDYLAF